MRGYWKFELLGGELFHKGMKVGAAAGLVHSGRADDHEFLALAQPLGVDRCLSADHADGGELGDLVGDGHEVGDGTKGLAGKGGVEAGHQDTLAKANELDGQRKDRGVKELYFVDTDYVDPVELRVEFLTEPLDGGDGDCFVGLRAVGGDGAAMVAEVYVGLVTGHALASDACPLQAADQLFGFA